MWVLITVTIQKVSLQVYFLTFTRWYINIMLTQCKNLNNFYSYTLHFLEYSLILDLCLYALMTIPIYLS